jgi:hypothetical protein
MIASTSRSGFASLQPGNRIGVSYDPKGSLTPDGNVGYCDDSEIRPADAGTPSNCSAAAFRICAGFKYLMSSLLLGWLS